MRLTMRISRGLRHVVIDSAIGLAIFMVLLGLCFGHGDAQARALIADVVNFNLGTADLGQQIIAQLPLAGEQASASGLPSYVFRNTNQPIALTILGIIFTALMALNIGFWRHLREAYAFEPAERQA